MHNFRHCYQLTDMQIWSGKRYFSKFPSPTGWMMSTAFWGEHQEQRCELVWYLIYNHRHRSTTSVTVRCLHKLLPFPVSCAVHFVLYIAICINATEQENGFLQEVLLECVESQTAVPWSGPYCNVVQRWMSTRAQHNGTNCVPSGALLQTGSFNINFPFFRPLHHNVSAGASVRAAVAVWWWQENRKMAQCTRPSVHTMLVG